MSSVKPITWFLASDDVKVKSDWLRRWPMKVVSYDSTPTHLELGSTSTTMRDILMDIFLLSESDFLIGTWYSSFSQIVLALGRLSTRNYVYGERCNVSSSLVQLASEMSRTGRHSIVYWLKLLKTRVTLLLTFVFFFDLYLYPFKFLLLLLVRQANDESKFCFIYIGYSH